MTAHAPITLLRHFVVAPSLTLAADSNLHTLFIKPRDMATRHWLYIYTNTSRQQAKKHVNEHLGGRTVAKSMLALLVAAANTAPLILAG